MKKKGFMGMPLSLKVLFVLFIIWILGSISMFSTRMEEGLPFFGFMIAGDLAAIVVLVLDILGPLGILYAMWNKEKWGPHLAYGIIGIFVLNSVIAAFVFSSVIPPMQVLMPAIVYGLFALVIYRKQDHFK